MGDIIPFQSGQLSSVFGKVPQQDDLSAGIAAGFGHIGYKGKVWSVRYRGDETILMRDDKDGPRNSIEVVIVKSANVIAKIWYENRYVEGSNEAPDCFSTNGITPEVSSRHRQSTACAICPRNVWGSRVTDSGKQGKECQDNKRLAVVPLQDIRNDMYGGPLLLRVPAASLGELANYGQTMHRLGYPYYSIGTRIAFDPQSAYPRFTFQAIRPLKDEEAQVVLEHQNGHLVERILAEMEGVPPINQAELQRQQEMIQAFEQPPQNLGAQPSPTPASAPRPQAVNPAPAQTASPQQTQSGFGPSTSSGPSPNAQPAEKPSGTATSSGLGPATPATRTAKKSGSATTASQAPTEHTKKESGQTASGGFGPTAPATPQTAGGTQNGSASTDPWEAAKAAADQNQDNPEGNGSEFEAALDAKLNNLLPS